MNPRPSIAAAFGPTSLFVLLWVAASLLLYRLLAVGNLVNVTSLFYLVPAGTAVLDWLVLGNVMAPVTRRDGRDPGWVGDRGADGAGAWLTSGFAFGLTPTYREGGLA